MDSSPPSDTTVRLRLYLLGGFRAEHDDVAIPDRAWQRRKTKALVKALASTPGHRLHRERVLDFLWPEVDPETAMSGFYKALHLARHILEPNLTRGDVSSYLHVTDDVVALDSDGIWIDADAFERSALEGISSRSVSGLETALSLYAGELLPEDLYEDWAAARRESLATLHGRILLQLADVLQARGDAGDALQRLQQALARDSAWEEVHQRLMRLHASQGNRNAALRQYTVLREALRESLDAEPDDETERLLRDIRAGKIAAMVPSESDATRDRLPAHLRRQPATPLIGRERALDLLLQDFEAIDVDRSTAVLVSGEAGVGKTRLMTEVARHAAEGGAVVLWAASYTPEGQLPFAPIAEALTGWLTGLSDHRRADIAATYPELSPLLPILGGKRPSGASDPRAEGARLFSAVARLLSDVSEEGLVLLIFDDLHAADAATLSLFHHLVRVAPDQRGEPPVRSGRTPARRGRWSIAAAYREEDVETGGPLHTLLASIERTGLARHIDLLRLARPDCDALVAAVLDGGKSPIDLAVLDRIHALSLGNPLFAGELIRSMRYDGRLILDEGRWMLGGDDTATEPLPRHVREIVDSRIYSLGEDAIRMLSLAATAGTEISLDILAAAAGHAYPKVLGEHAVLDALDAALEARVLEEHGRAYTFHHPLFREALYGRLSGNRRTHLHRSLARAIEVLRPEDVEALAYHYSRAGDRTNAVTYLQQAAERAAALHAHSTAEQHSRAILRQLSDESEPERSDEAGVEAAARERLSAALYFQGRQTEALPEAERAVALYEALGNAANAGRLSPADRLDGLARASVFLAYIHMATAAPDTSLAKLQVAIDVLESHGHRSSALARLYIDLGSINFYVGRYAEMLQATEIGSQLARSLNDGPLLALADSRRGLALQFVGRIPEARAVFEACIPILEEVEDARGLALALNNLANICELYGESASLKPAGRLGYRSRALETAERSGEPWLHGYMTTAVGTELVNLGKWREARECFKRAKRILAPAEASITELWLVLYEATLDYMEGDWDAARSALAHVAEEGARLPDIQMQRQAATVMSELDLVDRNPIPVVDRLEPLLDRPGMIEPQAGLLLPLLALAYLEMGDAKRAEGISSEALQRFNQPEGRAALPSCLCSRGVICARMGSPRESDAAFRHGLEIARSISRPWQEAGILAAWGEESFSHDAQAGQERLRAAHMLFTRLGASREIARVERLLSAM